MTSIVLAIALLAMPAPVPGAQPAEVQAERAIAASPVTARPSEPVEAPAGGPDSEQPEGAVQRGRPEACDPIWLEARLAAAAQADATLREIEECDPAELRILSEAVEALRACAGEVAPAPRWIFPVGGIRIRQSIGGVNGSGYQAARRLPCYATRYPGHPAHDLFVHDSDHDSRDRNGNPFPARAVEEGWVLVAHQGWTPEDPGKGGNYVLLYLPARHLVAYYAHLDEVLVRAGQRVAAGELVGTVGRTGLNAYKRRSPTHLHFGLWRADDFKPIDSYRMLVSADDSGDTVLVKHPTSSE
jgi:hypothetical protein